MCVSKNHINERKHHSMNDTTTPLWMQVPEASEYEVLLSFKYILDIDNTVKPIYGHQEGAELGYNPIKPGRPSHNYHSFFIGRARISLGVASFARHAVPRDGADLVQTRKAGSVDGNTEITESSRRQGVYGAFSERTSPKPSPRLRVSSQPPC